MLTKGTTIPAYLLCCEGFAVCLCNFTPRVAHLAGLVA